MPVVTRKIESANNFDVLFASNYGVLTRLIYRVVGDIGWAEEVAAEAFWKLHCKPPASNHNLVGWLYRTGLRLALDNLKKRKRRAHYEGLAPAPGAMQSPEEALQQREQQARVRLVLTALKPEQAVLLVLRRGYNHGGTSATLCSTPVRWGLSGRADISFRKEYANRYGER